MIEQLTTSLTQRLHIDVPIICGAMYPCSNPELVAAVSEAGGIGVVQPISLTYVSGYDFRQGLRYIKRLTNKPIGMNALIESSSRKYHQRMVEWVDIALEEGVRFFVTSLGKPDWVVARAHQVNAYVYHDVTEKKWAIKGKDAGVDGLIAVNNRAGGHAGARTAVQLFEELVDLNLPVICAGGVSTKQHYDTALSIGYDGVQMGTRFIACDECNASDDYKLAIVKAHEDDIVLTERITGVPVSVINTPYVQRVGTSNSAIANAMLGNKIGKRWVRTIFALRSLWRLKKDANASTSRVDYWQAGKSVADINATLSAKQIIESLIHPLNLS